MNLKQREIVQTADGSATIHIPEWNESYHSKHGAIQEAYHVFIKHGLDFFIDQKEISILELGFGTGLNALITMFESEGRQQKIWYTGVEKYPVTTLETQRLNYFNLIFEHYPNLKEEIKHWHTNAIEIHETGWEDCFQIAENFYLTKMQKDFFDLNTLEKQQFDLVYYDCFGARVQPELWTEKLFQIVYDKIKSGGILTTYSAKGSARRAMQEVGFTTQRLPGPPGKREMLTAKK